MKPNKINVRKLPSGSNITFQVVFTREYKLRLKLFIAIVRFATWVIGSKALVDVKRT